MGGCQAVLAFEIMTKPDLVADPSEEGLARGCGTATLKDLRSDLWHRGAFSFCGMGAQYNLQRPVILVWSTPQNLVGANGLWWRPDQWKLTGSASASRRTPG